MRLVALPGPIAVLIWLLLLPPYTEAKAPELKHVYAEMKALNVALAKAIKKYPGTKNFPPGKIDVNNATLADSYGLLGALNEKFAVLLFINNKAGFWPMSVPEGELNTTQLLNIIKILKHNCSLYLRQIIPPTNVTRSRLASEVLREVIKANHQLDRLLLGQITPQFPLYIVQRLEHELARLHRHWQLDPPHSPAKFELTDVRPTHVFDNAEIFHNYLRLIAKLKFAQSHPRRPYYFPMNKENIEPYHVFTLSAVNLYRLYLLQQYVGLAPDIHFSPERQQDAQPINVFQHYTHANAMLINLFRHWRK